MHDQPKATGYVRVIKRKSGPVFYAHIRTPDGRRLQRKLGPAWFKRSRPPAGHLTRSAAEEQLAAALDDESVEQTAGVTFGQVCHEWLRYVEHDRKRRLSTLRDYRNAVSHHLLPEFGADTPAASITVERVDRFRERLVAEGSSAATVNKLLALLHGAYRRAQRIYKLPVNPVAGAERQPQTRSGDFSVLSPAEVARLAEHAETEQDAALFTVAAFTGLRLGELRALRWSDIDWPLQLIHVRRSLPVKGEMGPPKSGKVRSVPLIDQAAAALNDRSRRERFTDDDDLVFVSTVGTPVEEVRLRRRFYAALDRAGLKRLRLHDLRHTFGTLAVQAFPLSDVKAYMGHSDIATTMIYVHHVPQRDAADRLSTLVQTAQTGDDFGAHSVHTANANGASVERNGSFAGKSERPRQDSNLGPAE
jgi:integrase